MKKLLFFLIVFYLSLLVLSCSRGGGGESSSSSEKIDTLFGDSEPDTSDSSDSSGSGNSSVASSSCPSSSTYTLDSSSTADNTTISDNSSITDNSDVDNSTVRVCSTIIRAKVDNSTVDNSTIIGSTVTNSTLDNSSILDNSTIRNSIIDNSTVDNMTIINISIVINQELYNDNLDGFNSSTRPTVLGTYVRKNNSWVDGNGGSSLEAEMGTNIRILFSESMDTSSITVNTSDTTCSGYSIQVSKAVSGNYFTSCVQMSSTPSASNNNKTFTVDPSANLEEETTYKIRVTTGVKDGSGNSMSDNYTTGNGFETEKD